AVPQPMPRGDAELGAPVELEAVMSSDAPASPAGPGARQGDAPLTRPPDAEGRQNVVAPRAAEELSSAFGAERDATLAALPQAAGAGATAAVVSEAAAALDAGPISQSTSPDAGAAGAAAVAGSREQSPVPVSEPWLPSAAAAAVAPAAVSDAAAERATAMASPPGQMDAGSAPPDGSSTTGGGDLSLRG